MNATQPIHNRSADSTRVTSHPGSNSISNPSNSPINSNLVSSLIRAPQKLVEQLTLIPEIINGVTRAYRFERIGHDAVMDALGIHVGDRLTAVNGIPVDLVPSISRYLANATRHGHIRLQIEDRHHSREIEFTLAAG